MLYIFSFLHQTTTAGWWRKEMRRCISLAFYIKPQLILSTSALLLVVYLQLSTSNHNRCFRLTICSSVVYLQLSTSNHNCLYARFDIFTLYIFSFLHQTTTRDSDLEKHDLLYIFSFLHQTTTTQFAVRAYRCCISLAFYIKPQHSKGRTSK